MSVPKPKRNLSRMEFVDNANKLEMYTIVHCGRFPKRYTFTLAHPIIGYARDVYNLVAAANEYPCTIKDYETREKRFRAAISKLNEMVRQLGIAEELGLIRANVMEGWIGLIDRETRLIYGTISSDKTMIKIAKDLEEKENQIGL